MSLVAWATRGPARTHTRTHARTPPRVTSRHVGCIDAEEGEGGEEGRKKASDRAGKKGVTRTGPQPGQQHTRHPRRARATA